MTTGNSLRSFGTSGFSGKWIAHCLFPSADCRLDCGGFGRRGGFTKLNSLGVLGICQLIAFLAELGAGSQSTTKEVKRSCELRVAGAPGLKVPKMRMSMRRFTRLTDAHSKKIENHGHAIAIYFMHYNFCKIHSTLRREQHQQSPFKIGLGD